MSEFFIVSLIKRLIVPSHSIFDPQIDLLQTWDTDDECNPSEDEEKRENERKKTNRKWKRGEGIGIGSDGIEYKLVILPHSKLYKGCGLC